MTKRTPDQKYGTHLARRLLESYDGCDAGVRGAPITVAEADAYIEGLVAQLEEARAKLREVMDNATTLQP